MIGTCNILILLTCVVELMPDIGNEPFSWAPFMPFKMQQVIDSQALCRSCGLECRTKGLNIVGPIALSWSVEMNKRPTL